MFHREIPGDGHGAALAEFLVVGGVTDRIGKPLDFDDEFLLILDGGGEAVERVRSAGAASGRQAVTSA